MTEATATAPANTDKQFPCPACGAALHFQPGATNLECPYCGHSEHIPQSEDEIGEQDFHEIIAALENAAPTQEAAFAKCGECGAEVERPEGLTSFDCAYCGSPIVDESSACTVLQPQSLLPFKVERKQAEREFETWLGSLWFAPGNLKTTARVGGALKGIYVPHFTYDSNTVSFYRGQRGDNYTTTETYTTMENGKSVTKTRTVTKTRWTSVSGTVYNAFDDILVCASTSMPEKLMHKLEPWDLENLKAFSADFLSGFSAEKYQVSLEDGFDHAKGQMAGTIENTIEHDIGGDKQRIDNVSTNYRNVTFKHIMLPVWISTYRYNGEPYRFVINARTGEVQGERPWSVIKIVALIVAILVVIVGIVMGIGAIAG